LANLRIRCFGFTDADHQQLQALLSQYNSSLNYQWQISRLGHAVLYFYNIDNAEGLKAWQHRDINLLNIYCSRRKINHEKNLLQIKLPLTSSNLFSVFAFAERHFAQSTKLSAKGFHFLQSPAKVINPRLFSMWLGNKLLGTQAKPAADLPKLHLLTSVVSSEQRGDIITDPALLKTWLSQLTDDLPQRLSILLANLQSIKQQHISESRQINLLDVYYLELKRLLLSRDSKIIAAESSLKRPTPKNLTNFSQTLRCLAELYFTLADKHYQRGERPADQTRFLFCLNRGSELIALQILHATVHYRTAPKDCWLQLNQLLIYLEKAKALDLKPEISPLVSSDSFAHIYKLIALTVIADPYSLSKHSVIRLYSMLSEVVNKVLITDIPPQQQVLENAFLLTGFFCIEADTDQAPKAMSKTPQLIRQIPDNRMLQTQDVLTILGQKLIPINKQENRLDLLLIRQVMPQLAASYQRQSPRKQLIESGSVELVHGYAAIVNFLNGAASPSMETMVLNNSEHGSLLLITECNDNIDVNELVLLKMQNSLQLATICWFCNDWQNNAQAGLSLIDGTPEIVTCQPKSGNLVYPALQLNTQIPALITQKGVFSPKRQLTVFNAKGDPLNVETKDVYSATLDYERFTYIIKAGS
tara:strand:+ start:226484 stop:228412 length:1929 start_codon:yes stop_codon:yes gene_type:complete